MFTRYLTVVLVIFGFCLFYFPGNAGVCGTNSSGHSSMPKKPVTEKANDFSRGTRKWQTYASAAAGDHGKGEMYAFHLGYGYFLRDYLSVNIDLLGAYIRSGLDDNGVAAGLDVCGYTPQSWFLLDCGLDSLLQAAGPTDTAAYLQQAQQAKTLILPGEMGERFKCIGLARGIELSVPGFRMQDQRGRL